MSAQHGTLRTEPHLLNSAVLQGRGDVWLAALVAVILTAVVSVGWLHILDLGASFDAGRRLSQFEILLGDTDARTIPLLAAFSAVAIALAVALASAIAQLSTVDDQHPPTGSLTSETEWVRRRTPLIVLILAEMLLTVAATSLTALGTMTLAMRSEAAIAAFTALLTLFLLIETIRCLVVLRFRPATPFTPPPDSIAERLNRLAEPRRSRTVYSIAWWISWAACTVALAATFSAIAEHHATKMQDTSGEFIGGFLAIQMMFFFGVGVARWFSRDGVTQSRGGRVFTVIGALVYATLLLLVIHPSVLISLVHRDDPEWFLIAGLLLLLAFECLLVLRVLDEAGIGARWSPALSRRRYWTSPPPRLPRSADNSSRSCWGSVMGILAVAGASVGFLGIAHPSGAILAMITAAGIFSVADARWAHRRASIAILIVWVLAVCAIASIRPSGNIFYGTWAGYTAMALAATHLSTQTGGVLTHAPNQLRRWINRRRELHWQQRLSSLSLAEDHNGYRATDRTRVRSASAPRLGRPRPTTGSRLPGGAQPSASRSRR